MQVSGQKLQNVLEGKSDKRPRAEDEMQRGKRNRLFLQLDPVVPDRVSDDVREVPRRLEPEKDVHTRETTGRRIIIKYS